MLDNPYTQVFISGVEFLRNLKVAHSKAHSKAACDRIKAKLETTGDRA